MASLFEQIAPQRFLERQFRTLFPVRISALAVGDLAGAGRYDLVFATEEKDERRVRVAFAHSAEGYEYNDVTPILTLPDTAMRLRDLAVHDVDDDRVLDVLLILSRNGRESLGIVYGAGNGTMSDTVTWVEGVHPLSRQLLILRDLNGDHKTDIAALDATRNAVVASYTTGSRRFGDPEWVASARGVSGFAVASLRSGDSLDLVLSNREKGTMSIIWGPFRWGSP
jgi:hypothetical protein